MGNFEDVSQLLQYGLVGIMLYMVIRGKYIVPAWALESQRSQFDRELAAKDEIIRVLSDDRKQLKVTVDRLNELNRSEVLPAVIRSNELAAELILHLRGDVLELGPGGQSNGRRG